MKAAALLSLSLLTALPIFAQYSARQLTRKVAPQPAQRPAAQPAAPAARQPVPLVTAPAAPVDPKKVAAEKSKSERDLIAWQTKRATDGSDSAQYDLGIRYLTGNGVPANPKTAREWLEKSAKSGNVKAVKKLEELKSLAPAPSPSAVIPTPASASAK